MCVSWYLWTVVSQILIWPLLKIGITKYPTLESEMFWTASLRRGQRMHLRQLLKCELSGGGRVGRPRWPKNCRRRPRWKSRKVEKSVKQTCRRLLATHDPRSVQVYFKSSIDRLPTFSNNNDESGNGYLVWCSRTVTEGGHIYVTCAFCKLTSIRAPFLVWSPFHWLESERWSYNILFIMYTMYINI